MPAAEREVLLLCARLALPEGGAARLRALLAAVDGDRLLALAARNGATGFLHRHLSALGEDGGAAELRARAAARAGEDARRSLAMTAELLRLLDVLAAAGVRALPYKGPALGVAAYGDPALRPYNDLDLLVAEAEIDRGSAALAAAGYAPEHDLAGRHDALFRRVDGDYPFVGSATGTRVEVHARASSRRFGVALEADALLARAGTVRLAGRDVPAAAPADLGVILCVHGAKHRWERLEWVTALAELLRRGSLDADALVLRATDAGGRRAALLGLLLARTLLDAPLPRSARAAAMADAGLARLAAQADARMFRPPAADEPDGTAPNLLFNLRLADSPAARLRLAARWLFVPTPEDWAWLPLPAPLQAAARPVRLLARYARPGGPR